MVRIIVFLAVAAVVAGSFSYVHKVASRLVIDPVSYAKAGNLVKAKFPEYAVAPDKEIGRRLFEKGYLTPEQYGTLLERGFTDQEIYDLVDRTYALPTRERSVWYGGWLLASLALVSVTALILKGRKNHAPESEVQNVLDDKSGSEQ